MFYRIVLPYLDKHGTTWWLSVCNSEIVIWENSVYNVLAHSRFTKTEDPIPSWSVNVFERQTKMYAAAYFSSFAYTYINILFCTRHDAIFPKTINTGRLVFGRILFQSTSMYTKYDRKAFRSAI